MQTTVITSELFDREAKRLRRKHKHLTEGIELLIEKLSVEPEVGLRIEEKYYKIRVGIKGLGKCGGFRVCYYYKESVIVLLLSVYSKSEQDDISIKELKRRAKIEGYE